MFEWSEYRVLKETINLCSLYLSAIGRFTIKIERNETNTMKLWHAIQIFAGFFSVNVQGKRLEVNGKPRKLTLAC
jgi:hypothetical protein